MKPHSETVIIPDFDSGVEGSNPSVAAISQNVVTTFHYISDYNPLSELRRYLGICDTKCFSCKPNPLVFPHEC